MKHRGHGKKGINLNEKNGQWVGDKVSKTALHAWVRRKLEKPAKCPMCGKKGFIELSCIGHNYVRDLKFWRYLCRSCHTRIDGKGKYIRDKSKFRITECLTCGTSIRRPSIYCKPCARIRRLEWWKEYNIKRGRKKNNKRCLDCGVEISPRRTRCISCSRERNKAKRLGYEMKRRKKLGLDKVREIWCAYGKKYRERDRAEKDDWMQNG